VVGLQGQEYNTGVLRTRDDSNSRAMQSIA